MRILIAQMTRMGDMIQTSPLIRAIKVRYPESHVTAMVRRMGIAIAERNPDIDDTIVYDEDEMFCHLRKDDSDRLLKAYERAEQCIRELREGDFDLVYNCTHSLSSAVLLKAANARDVIGAHLSDDWQFVLRGRGTNYFFTSVHNRDYNDLNVCDLYRMFEPEAPPFRGLVFDITEEDRRAAADLLRNHGIGDGDFVACLQLGASENDKRWPETHFAALGRHLVETRGARILLSGVESEAPLGEAFEQAAPGLAVPLFGKTSIPVLAAVLERANVLVTNDTGTMHIAAAMKCPIVLVSVGYVHFRETGPYGTGFYAVELARDTLGRSDTMRGNIEQRALVLPEHVAHVVGLAVDGNADDEQLRPEDGFESIDVFVSGFAGDGCLQWYPVVRRDLTRRDFVRLVYRTMWSEHLRGISDQVGEAESIRLVLERFAGGPGDTAPWREELVAAFRALADLGTRGDTVTGQLLDVLTGGRKMQEAKELVSQLMALDEEIRLFGDVHEACRPLVNIGRFERDNLEGADPVQLAETTLAIYRDLETRALLAAEKAERIDAIRRGGASTTG
ncbi:MAG: glycosyltransferase family 9 protein [bacterium]|nr:glycosyltransferase family 9 protein [bacterium]